MSESPDHLLRQLHEELQRQDGVVSRRQVLAAGLAPHDLERLVRRRLLVPRGQATYVDHTAPPTWRQRAWSAVLALGPAAIGGESALALAEGRWRAPDALVHVVIAVHRSTPAPLPGVLVRHVSDLDARVQWHLGPPRLRYEEAVLDVAGDAESDLAAIAVLAAAVSSRITTAARLLETLARRARMPRRAWLESVLRDVAEGTCSVLEHGQLTLVERPHGLPPAVRQRPDQGRAGRIYRDASYGGGVEVELDGRLHERRAHRDADMDRDLDVAAAGGVPVRIGFAQVFDRPCLTAAALAQLLLVRGVRCSPHPCSPGCPVGQVAAELRGSDVRGA